MGRVKFARLSDVRKDVNELTTRVDKMDEKIKIVQIDIDNNKSYTSFIDLCRVNQDKKLEQAKQKNKRNKILKFLLICSMIILSVLGYKIEILNYIISLLPF